MGHPFSGYIVYWNKRIYRELNAMYDRKLAAYGLTTGQVNVLEQLWTLGDGMTQKELHERLGIRPASLTNLLNALVEGGWVVRKSDPQDARSKRIYLTDAGQAQSKICMGIITELESVVRQGMSQEEISLMLVWLQKIHNNVSNEE